MRFCMRPREGTIAFPPCASDLAFSHWTYRLGAAAGRSRERRPAGCSNYATYWYPLEAGVGALFDNEIQYFEKMKKVQAEAASNHLRPPFGRRCVSHGSHKPDSDFFFSPSVTSHGRFPAR